MTKIETEKLETRLRRAFPHLTDADFAHHATDLYVIASPEIIKWLFAGNWPEVR